ncbi:hypothetical protein AAHC03_013939 [Spirometra sp. Aus1]
MIIVTLFAYYILKLAKEPLRTNRIFHPPKKRLHQLKLQDFVVDSGRINAKREGLPNLENLPWPEREFLTIPMGAPGNSIDPLGAKFSRAQMRTMLNLLNIFANAMEEIGASDRWMIYSGSLIGSFRHHDITPWDDDVDVLVDLSVKTALWRQIQKLTPQIYINGAGLRDKIYAKLIEPNNTLQDVDGSRRLSAHSWSWPYVDIGYYSSNSTHIRELARSYGRTYIYAKTDVFPLLLRPFYTQWVPAPRNTFAFLQQSYPDNVHCSALGYFHPLEIHTKGRSLPCNELADRYAFVERVSFNNSVQKVSDSSNDLDWVRERLIRGGEVIHEIDLVAPQREGFVDTYVLQMRPQK